MPGNRKLSYSEPHMRFVIQRVKKASVRVDGQITGSIGPGLLVLAGIASADTTADADYLIDRTLSLRIFPDSQDRMNRSLLDTGGGLLVVSQFTLYGDVRKGRRPSFDKAAPPDKARLLYDYLLAGFASRGQQVQAGVFQAAMEVELINDGPVTILCDSERLL